MPLTFVEAGKTFIVQRVSGKEEMRAFLEGLGLVPGSSVTVVSKNPSGVILNVKESRVALGRDMANKVLV